MGGRARVSICAICGETECSYAIRSQKCWSQLLARVEKSQEGYLIQFDCVNTCLSSDSFGVSEKPVGFIQDNLLCEQAEFWRGKSAPGPMLVWREAWPAELLMWDCRPPPLLPPCASYG